MSPSLYPQCLHAGVPTAHLRAHMPTHILERELWPVAFYLPSFVSFPHPSVKTKILIFLCSFTSFLFPLSHLYIVTGHAYRAFRYRSKFTKPGCQGRFCSQIRVSLPPLSFIFSFVYSHSFP